LKAHLRILTFCQNVTFTKRPFPKWLEVSHASSLQSLHLFNPLENSKCRRAALAATLMTATHRRCSFRSSQSDTTHCTMSVNMLIHNSMRKSRQVSRREEQEQRLLTPCMVTERMQKLYESFGGIPRSKAEENQFLYQTLDCERKQLIRGKGLTSIIYEALKREGAKVELLQSGHNVKREECAARLLLHTLLLEAYRKVEEKLIERTAKNNQLHKSVIEKKRKSKFRRNKQFKIYSCENGFLVTGGGPLPLNKSDPSSSNC